MAAQSPLRRWKRFFSMFDTIDAAIVASQRDEEVGCAKVLRQAKVGIVELLCDASKDDPAEDLCRILDDVMVEYLITLKSVPVTPSALATTGLAKAVGALEEHESEQVRGLARDIVDIWRASVESDLAKARARVEELRKLSEETLATKPSWTTQTAIRSSNLVEMAKSNVPAKVPAQLDKKSAPVVCAGRATVVSADKMMVPAKMPAVVGNGGRDHVEIDKVDDTKRKLREGYQEVEDAKRQRKIIVSKGPKMVKQQQQQQQQQRKMIEQQRRPATIPTPLFREIEIFTTPSAHPKKSAAVVGVSRASMSTTEKMPAMDKMEATKRKIWEGYQEAADSKRQRKIIVTEAPTMDEQRRRKMHPIVRERSQAR